MDVIKLKKVMKKAVSKKIIKPIPVEPSWDERVKAAWSIVKKSYPAWKAPDLAVCGSILPFKSTETYDGKRSAYPVAQSMHCGIGYIYSWTYDWQGKPSPFTELTKAIFLVWCDYMRYKCPYGLIYTTTASHQVDAIALLKEVGWTPSAGGSNNTHDFREAVMWVWVNHPPSKTRDLEFGNQKEY